MKIMPRVRVRTPLNPTESPAKVKVALLNLFPDLVFVEAGSELVGEAASLDHLRKLIRNQRIRDTARSVLLRGRRGSAMRFTLSKQPAYVGRVNFGGATGPLGDIDVSVEDEDLDALIDHVAESTVGRRLTLLDRSEGT